MTAKLIFFSQVRVHFNYKHLFYVYEHFLENY